MKNTWSDDEETDVVQEGFGVGYPVDTKETPTALVSVIGALVALMFLYVVFYVFYLPSWKNFKRQHGDADVDTEQQPADNEVPSDATGPTSDSDNRVSGESRISRIDQNHDQQLQQQQPHNEEAVSLLRPDSQPNPIQPTNIESRIPHDESMTETGLQSPSTNDRASAVPSTTSSSRLQQRLSETPLRTWDLGNMRWSHKGSLRRIQSIQRMVQAERQAQAATSEDGSNASRSRSSRNSRPVGGRTQSHRGLSDVASSILTEGIVEGEAQYYRQRYIERSRSRRRRGPNSSASSDRSLMPALSPDAISPDDAADAHDPGTLNQGYTYDIDDDDDDEFDCLKCCSPVGNLLDYSDLDFETRRILTLALPSTIEAVADPFFRMGVVALLSNFLDTNSMVAFLLVSLLIRTSVEELSGAVADAQSALLQEAMAQGGNHGFTLAGRFVQLGMLMQFLFVVPVLILWSVFVDDMVGWMVPENDNIAQMASEYTRVIVAEYAIRAGMRSFMLVLHLTGQAQFELNVDLSVTAITIAIISIASNAADDITLNTIAWIQVAIAFVTALGKVAYISYRGSLRPFQEGLFGFLTLFDTEKVKMFVYILFPLILGSLVEIGEWKILTFFVQHLGGAEVATWAMMGIVWEVFEAFTEGLGEASAVRVSYYLTENLPVLAEQIANKAVFLSFVEETILTAIFLMIGPNLSVALTRDAALQNLFNDLVPMVALTNMAMSLAQIYWSLLGAQGYFSKASGLILMDRWLFMIPLGCTMIYGAFYDLLAVAGALAVGYTIAGTILANYVINSNWAYAAGGEDEDVAFAEPGLALESEQEEEEESEDDSSTGFG